MTIWVDVIRSDLERGAAAFISAGANLVKAKETLPHGQFEALVVELGITPRTAQRFMAISRNVVLADATRVSHLPTAWGTLYELSRVPDEVLEAAIDAGEVTPKTTRAEAAALRPVAHGRQVPSSSASEAADRLAVLMETMDAEELEDILAFADASDDQFDAAIVEATAEGDPSRANVRSKLDSVSTDLNRLADLESSIQSGIDTIRTDLETAGGMMRLRLLDELLRRVPEDDGRDHEIGITLLSAAIHVLDGMPPAAEPADPVGALSASLRRSYLTSGRATAWRSSRRWPSSS